MASPGTPRQYSGGARRSRPVESALVALDRGDARNSASAPRAFVAWPDHGDVVERLGGFGDLRPGEYRGSSRCFLAGRACARREIVTADHLAQRRCAVGRFPVAQPCALRCRASRRRLLASCAGRRRPRRKPAQRIGSTIASKPPFSAMRRRRAVIGRGARCMRGVSVTLTPWSKASVLIAGTRLCRGTCGRRCRNSCAPPGASGVGRHGPRAPMPLDESTPADRRALNVPQRQFPARLVSAPHSCRCMRIELSATASRVSPMPKRGRSGRALTTRGRSRRSW